MAVRDMEHLEDAERHVRAAINALRALSRPEKCGKRWFSKSGYIIYRGWLDGGDGQVECSLPKGHSGAHHPDAETEWR